MRNRMAVVVLALALPACDGGSRTPATPPTPAPAPTPTPVSYSGTYSGTMSVTAAGMAAVPVTGRTTITQTGDSLAFSDLTITGAVNGTFGAGNAVLSSNTFNGAGASNTAACGASNSTWTGYFSNDGRLLNLKVVLAPRNRNCFDYQFLGELARM
jgi:hypothetical protein